MVKVVLSCGEVTQPCKAEGIEEVMRTASTLFGPGVLVDHEGCAISSAAAFKQPLEQGMEFSWKQAWTGGAGPVPNSAGYQGGPPPPGYGAPPPLGYWYPPPGYPQGPPPPGPATVQEATTAMARLSSSLGVPSTSRTPVYYKASFTITEGVEYAYDVVDQVQRVPNMLKGYMRIESLNREQGTSKFIFQVVSDDKGYLQSFVDFVQKAGPRFRQKDPEHVFTRAEEVSVLEAGDAAVDPRLTQEFQVTSARYEAVGDFWDEVKQRQPSGLGHGSDVGAPFHSRSSSTLGEE